MSASPSRPQSHPDVDPRLLEVLVCPITHGVLEYDRERGELISRGVPVEPDAIEALMRG